MNVAITGASGLFGGALVRVFRARHTVTPVTHRDMDITDSKQVRETISGLRPEVVIHTAAIRDPDTCEVNPAQAFLVNFHGTRQVMEAASHAGARMAYISTDSVFDGKKETPYRESDAAIPASVYGRTKLRAERLVLARPESWAFRVSILFGPTGDSGRGKPKGTSLAKACISLLRVRNTS